LAWQDIRRGKQDRLLVPNVNLRLLVVDHSNFRGGKGLGVSDLFKEIQLDVGRKLKEVTVLAKIGELTKRELLARTTEGKFGTAALEVPGRLRLIWIGQTIGLTTVRSTSEPQHQKELRSQAVVAKMIFQPSRAFRLVPDNRVHLFIGMHPFRIGMLFNKTSISFALALTSKTSESSDLDTVPASAWYWG
jgi:hypothetical protein